MSRCFLFLGIDSFYIFIYSLLYFRKNCFLMISNSIREADPNDKEKASLDLMNL